MAERGKLKCEEYRSYDRWYICHKCWTQKMEEERKKKNKDKVFLRKRLKSKLILTNEEVQRVLEVSKTTLFVRPGLPCAFQMADNSQQTDRIVIAPELSVPVQELPAPIPKMSVPGMTVPEMSVPRMIV
jgi:hypothetical protein